MKIGILTQPLQSNYGGILQAYALQTILEDMGHEVMVIDRRYNSSLMKNIFKKTKQYFKKYILRNKVLISGKKQDEIICQNTLAFVKKYIHRTDSYYSSKSLSRVSKYGFDLYIVGSDQVWRPIYSPCIYDYFVGFESGTKKISYAASFGVNIWEYTDTQTKKCRILLNEFSAVSVREDDAVEMCEKYFGYGNAKHVLDPTMLVDRSRYIDLLNPVDNKERKGNLLVYILDENNDKRAVIEKLSVKYNYKPFRVNADIYNPNFSVEDRIAPPVEEWIRGFYESEFVITDSFHACVFSVLFNKPFIIYGNTQRGMSRFKSLLKKFSLEDRLITSSSQLLEDLISKQIDWIKVNEILLKERQFSLNFLESNIS